MIFSARLPLSSLIELCRSLHHYLGAGFTVPDVFAQLATRGSGPLRAVSQRIHAGVKRGRDLEDMLTEESAAFPPLLVALAKVGEQSGNVPEMFGELEQYYRRQQQLRRDFWSQAAWPIFQFVFATLVIAALYVILDAIAGSRPEAQPGDPMSLGSTGVTGAIMFLVKVYGGLLVLATAYLIVTRALRQGPIIHTFLLRMWIIGPCLESLALTRLCLALRMTLDTSLSLAKSLGLSFNATGNPAYVAKIPMVVKSVKAGDELVNAFTRTRLFPHEFLQIVAIGEESGRLVEVMKQQSQYYQEESRRRTQTLAKAASWGVYCMVAGFIIFLIFKVLSTSILPARDVAF